MEIMCLSIMKKPTLYLYHHHSIYKKEDMRYMLPKGRASFLFLPPHYSRVSSKLLKPNLNISKNIHVFDINSS